MPVTLYSGPATEPITVTELRRQLRLGDTAGEPAPTAPTAALASPAVAGSVDAGAHRYCVTFVTADGETEAGVVTAAVTVANPAVNGKVSLTAIPLGGSAVTSRKLYRTVAGGSTYLLLATVANNTATTYTDNIADSALGAEVPSINTTVDPTLTRLIQTVRERAEAATQRAFITQTWDWLREGWGSDGYIEMPKPPLVSITSVAYLDSTGASQSLTEDTDFIVQAPAGPRCCRGRIALAYGMTWPATYGQMGDVTIRFVAGYGAAGDVPAMLKDAMLLHADVLYNPREESSAQLAQVHHIYWSYRSHGRQRLVA